jgi:hypothetical protein
VVYSGAVQPPLQFPRPRPLHALTRTFSLRLSPRGCGGHRPWVGRRLLWPVARTRRTPPPKHYWGLHNGGAYRGWRWPGRTGSGATSRGSNAGASGDWSRRWSGDSRRWRAPAPTTSGSATSAASAASATSGSAARRVTGGGDTAQEACGSPHSYLLYRRCQ